MSPPDAAIVRSLNTHSEAETCGKFYVMGGVIGENFEFSASTGALTVKTSTELTVQNVNIDSATTNRIIIADDVNASLVLDGVWIATNNNSGEVEIEVVPNPYPDEDVYEKMKMEMYQMNR